MTKIIQLENVLKNLNKAIALYPTDSTNAVSLYNETVDFYHATRREKRSEKRAWTVEEKALINEIRVVKRAILGAHHDINIALAICSENSIHSEVEEMDNSKKFGQEIIEYGRKHRLLGDNESKMNQLLEMEDAKFQRDCLEYNGLTESPTFKRVLSAEYNYCANCSPQNTEKMALIKKLVYNMHSVTK